MISIKMVQLNNLLYPILHQIFKIPLFTDNSYEMIQKNKSMIKSFNMLKQKPPTYFNVYFMYIESIEHYQQDCRYISYALDDIELSELDEYSPEPFPLKINVKILNIVNRIYKFISYIKNMFYDLYHCYNFVKNYNHYNDIKLFDNKNTLFVHTHKMMYYKKLMYYNKYDLSSLRYNCNMIFNNSIKINLRVNSSKMPYIILI